MKQILIVIFLLSVLGSTQANNLKDDLQGTWLCTKILDDNSQPTTGKFGASDEYLKFNFRKSRLSITESPFDPSLLGFNLKYGTGFIDLIPGSVYKIPEQVYFIKSLSEENLVLSTLNPSGDSIYYHFTNENLLIAEFNPKTDIVDLGLILIKHLKLDDGKGANRVSQYFIPNTREFLNPSPTFNDSRFASLGHYFSNNFKFHDTFPIDSVTNELIVEFDIKPKEIQNLKIIQGIGPDFDEQVLAILEKTRKKWLPLQIENEEIECRVRLHYLFYLGKMELIKFGQ